MSNISDDCYLGIARTLDLCRPLLQKHSDNSHATIITLFMNAVVEAVQSTPPSRGESISILQRVARYLPPNSPRHFDYDSATIKYVSAHDLLRDNEKYFNRSVVRIPISLRHAD